MFKFLPLFAVLLLSAAPALAAPGLVHISSEPGGAKVYINGQRKGTTPTQPGKVLEVQLEEGEYTLEAKTDDGAEAKFDLYIAADVIQPAHLVLLIHGRYLDNGDGTVTDVKTKLMWMRCSVGQTWDGSTCTGEAKRFTWEEAKKQTANFVGHSDWRIPTIEELRTLWYCSSGEPNDFDSGDNLSVCEGNSKKPTIAQAVFPNTPIDWFWSGSPYTYGSNYAWNVYFTYGHYGYLRSSSGHVRLVRGGQ